MSLRDALNQAVDSAFTAIGDIPVAITVKHFTGTPTRNATTGIWTRASTDYTDEAVLSNFEARESRANILQGDKKFFGRRRNVLLIEAGDEITHDDRVYTIVTVESDPLEVTYTAQAREKAR